MFSKSQNSAMLVTSGRLAMQSAPGMRDCGDTIAPRQRAARDRATLVATILHAMPPACPADLSPLEARVLGVLVEKQRTVPDTYPLTLNAIVAAATRRQAAIRS
jgi:hypothetical protein